MLVDFNKKKILFYCSIYVLIIFFNYKIIKYYKINKIY